MRSITFAQLIERSVSPELRARGTPDELRRARLTIIFALAMAFGEIPGVIVLFSSGTRTVSTILALSVVCQLMTPLVVYKARDPRIAGHFLVFVTWLNMLGTALFSGGIDSPGLVWWGTTVIFAVILLGTRVGLFWTVVTVVQLSLLFAAKQADVSIPDEGRPQDRAGALFGASSMALVAYYLLARSYEHLKERMLTEVAEAKVSVERAHTAARAVLDNVAEGLLIAGPDGRMGSERAAALTGYFGPVQGDETVFEYLGRVDAQAAQWLQVGWKEAFAGVMPLELMLDQLPKRVRRAARRFELSYHPIFLREQLSSILVAVTDVTQRVAMEEADEHHRELLSALRRVASDRSTFVAFIQETARRIDTLIKPDLSRTVALRELHTVKGNVGLFGLTSLARHCHELESTLIEQQRSPEPAERKALLTAWQQLQERLEPLLGSAQAHVELTVAEYNDALRAVQEHESYAVLLSRVRGWAHEPMHKRLGLCADQIRALGERLGKGDISVSVDDGGLRLPREALAPFWSSFTHVIRNAVDHGIETVEERRAARKSDTGQVLLSTRIEHGLVQIELSDDGRGIDWSRVAEKARALNLPAQTRQELEAALFSDGLSTRDSFDEVSGRGVGLSAVRATVADLGGSITVASSPGSGTRFTFSFPIAQVRPSLPPSAANDHNAAAG